MNVDGICLKKPKILPLRDDIEAHTGWQQEIKLNDIHDTHDHQTKFILSDRSILKRVFTLHGCNCYNIQSNRNGKIRPSIFDQYYISIVPWVLLVNSFVQFWRFLTYNFLHSGVVHLVINIFIQILLATPLEKEQGHLKVAIIYYGGVISGALGTSVFQPTVLMVGGSAGVYSLLISHVSHIIMNYDEISYRCFRIISVIVLCSSDIVFVLNHCLTKGNSEPRISVAAHGSGAAAGLLLGFAIYSSKTNPFYKRLRYSSAFLYVILVVLSIIFVILSEC